MRTSGWAGWAAAFWVGACAWATAGGDPAAEAQMARVRRSMPAVPLELEAAIRVVDSNGKNLKTVQAEAVLTPRDAGRTARYVLRDAFGGILEEMTVELGDAAAAFAYALGDPPQPSPLPDLFGPIQGSEISWMEMSFSYFWWPEPRIVGQEKVSNRWDCEIVEVDCPPEYPGGWSHIRLWVVPAYSAVVRGEVWRGGKAAKRFEVRSVKKLRQIYMIGDMEVKNLETGARARLKVGRMKMISPDYTPEELEEFNAPIAW